MKLSRPPTSFQLFSLQARLRRRACAGVAREWRLLGYDTWLVLCLRVYEIDMNQVMLAFRSHPRAIFDVHSYSFSSVVQHCWRLEKKLLRLGVVIA